MDRRMRTKLRTFLGRVVGARVWETTGHLVNGAGSSTANHAQDLIHHHPSSVTHHHCVRDSREKERKNVWMWTADNALCSCGGRLTRRKELKEVCSGLPRLSPRYKVGSSWSLDIGDQRRHYHRRKYKATRPPRISTMYRKITTLQQIGSNCSLSRMDFSFGGFTLIQFF